MSLAAYLLACCIVGTVFPSVSAGQTSDESINREYPLKALFLYNFGGYIDWPTDAFANKQSPFVIGVLGTAPIEATLKELAASKTIAGRRIVVEHFDTVSDIRPCHILFITRKISQQQQRMALATLKNQHVLIVGESEGFADQGGTVNFFIEANKVRFEINPDAAKEQELKISSKLLSLAKIVQGK